MIHSPFLEKIPPCDWLASNSLAFAVFDGFPVSPGHALVITRRLVATWFDATPAEQAAVMELVAVVKQQLDAALQPRPDGYNVGFNCGAAAGQTVDHLHVHVIPRYRGDVADPRGGVRHVTPAKANYLAALNFNVTAQAVLLHDSPPVNATAQAVRPRNDVAAPLSPAQRASPMSGQGNALDPATPTNISPSPNGAALTSAASTPQPISAPDTSSLNLSTGHPDSPLWDQLSWRLAGASQVDILASFVQLSGLDVIEDHLFDALRNAARVRILVGDYLSISDARALSRLVGWCELAEEAYGDQRLQARLIEIAKLPSGPASFHPKAWHIVEDGRVFISVGSSNIAMAKLSMIGCYLRLITSTDSSIQAFSDRA